MLTKLYTKALMADCLACKRDVSCAQLLTKVKLLANPRGVGEGNLRLHERIDKKNGLLVLCWKCSDRSHKELPPRFSFGLAFDAC